MATTALQALPYPVGSDTPAGHTQILALATAVEKKAVMVFASSAARTSALSAASVTATEGMLCWLQDTNTYEYYTGSAWRPITELGAGTGAELGYAEITANTSEITTLADVAGVSITFTLAVPRKVRITASAIIFSGTAGDTFLLNITDGASAIQSYSGVRTCDVANNEKRVEFSVRKSLSAATYTFKLRCTCATSVGTTVIHASSSNPCWIQAIDCGP